ncbi:MAG TPA: DUF4173 domain-containing protein [Gemmatimonadaceae bacterium]|nr:DUF4173 domain-containing protein [Gemmatimonadaceae bacterium]
MRIGLLWTFAAIAGALGAILLFDALPGINWSLWVSAAIAGLLIYRRPSRETLRVMATPLGFAVLLAAGAAVTTTPILRVAIVAIVASLMALAVLLASEHSAALDYGPIEIITAPFRALARTVRGAISSLAVTFDSIGSAHERPALRGAVIAAPVVLVLMLLFASADPVLARGRDAIYGVFSDWGDMPRIVFGLLLGLFVLGAYAATRTTGSSAFAPVMPSTGVERIGLTERRIVLGAAATVSWLFVLLQLSYLFGASPAIAGSGVTFAEYAHRGFGELTVAATIAALLIIAAHDNVRERHDSETRSAITWPSLALLAAVVCILVSAFHRIMLYEDAYGYTTTRVYVQAYMLLALAILFVLAWHVWRRFDVRALARQVMTVALATLAFLVFWNGDEWVAQANLDRYAHTGKLDVQYLTGGLSLDAYPALVQALPRVTEPERAQLSLALAREYARRSELHGTRAWYEWNLRRERARSFVVITHPANIPPSL